MKHNLGLIYALSAYVLWGVIPIFWRQIDHIGSTEIVMHRMLWSCLLVTAFIVVMGQWREFKRLFSKPKMLFRLFIASAIISANWGVFIWAVNSEHLVETSLGYFINPLISVAFGVVFFSERLRIGQWLALLIAASGVVYLIIAYGEFPLISFALAISFALYGLVKKTIELPATHGLGIETLFFVVPALIYLSVLEFQGEGQFFQGSSNWWMLILGGLFTLIPLLLFAAAAKRVSMTVLGMSQYIGPSLQLLTGVFLYHEPFGSERMIAFGLIWFALGIYSCDQILHRGRMRRVKKSNLAT